MTSWSGQDRGWSATLRLRQGPLPGRPRRDGGRSRSRARPFDGARRSGHCFDHWLRPSLWYRCRSARRRSVGGARVSGEAGARSGLGPCQEAIATCDGARRRMSARDPGHAPNLRIRLWKGTRHDNHAEARKRQPPRNGGRTRGTRHGGYLGRWITSGGCPPERTDLNHGCPLAGRPGRRPGDHRRRRRLPVWLPDHRRGGRAPGHPGALRSRPVPLEVNAAVSRRNT